jgi:hypothetical protein
VKQEHLDAEVVAGWADGTLDPQVRAAAEAHAADCVRCQAVLAAMVRSESLAAQPGRGWLAARVRWLVPLATAAAAAALWFGLSKDVLAPGTPPTVAGRTEPAAETVADRAAASPSPLVAGRDDTKREVAPDESRRRPLDAPAPPATRSEAPRRAEKSTAVTETAALDQVRRQAVTQPSAAPRAAPPPPVGTLAPTPQVARVEEQRRDPLAGRGAPPAPPQAAGQASQMPALTETVAVQTQSQQAQVQTQAATRLARQAAFSADPAAFRDVPSADPAVRYRIGVKGLIQRSADGGRSWTVQRSGVPDDLVAGAAPSADVCWVVGRSGVVLLTTDRGATWRRVPFPEPVDLRDVTATDARTASVTTLDGRVFRTTDAGRTWQR